MREIGIHEIEDIARGAAVLGAGGGGDPYIGKLMCIQAIKNYGKAKLISVDDLDDDDLILPIAMMGAPTVLAEKAMNGNEYEPLFEQMQKILGKKVKAVMPIEAGGVNSMIPFIAACRYNLPIVDVDAMGRAFPELQMVTFTIGGISATPMCLTDEKGNTSLINTISNNWTEKIARSITMTVGASVSMILYPVNGKQLKEYGIKGIITKSEIIGKCIKNKNIDEFLKLVNGYKLFKGKISDINRITKDGFNFGKTKLEGIDEYKDKKCEIDFQNENLCIKIDEKILATTPDLICLLDVDTLNPITTDMIKYGKRAIAIVIPCCDIWRSKKGIEIAGPRYFKIDCDYKSVEERLKCID